MMVRVVDESNEQTKAESTRPAPTVVARGVASVPAPRAQVAEHAAADRVRIGRGEGNDIVLGDLAVSRNHAELRRVGDRHEVVDLGSSNGIYHNGKRVPKAVLEPGDRISIGRHQLVFDGAALHQFVDTGPVSLSAQDLTVQIGKLVLLDDVSFTLRQGSLLAVVGPSGCGKSTMIRAVSGLRPASLGQVSYDGRDLYENFAELRYRIGMVPQDDVLHRQLTIRRALRFSASLRFADDVPRRERIARVDEVVGTLGLTDRMKQRIDTLSGGQRKRTSVALELLTEPSLLFLDEPTSGLDPALDKEVMEELRELADSGRTVVVVTHNPMHLDLCDRVMVMCVGGRMGYFGPPEKLFEFFGAKDYADVYKKVTNEGEIWARRFLGSEVYRQYVSDEANEMAAVAQAAAAPVAVAATPAAAAPAAVPAQREPAEDEESDAPVSPSGSENPAKAVGGDAKIGALPLTSRARHPSAPLRQYITLCLRMIAVIIADRGYAVFLLGLPMVLALLTHAVPGDHGLSQDPAGYNLEAQRLLVVLVVGASFLGIAVAIREIVNESSIYRRERAVGLLPGAYLASKLTVFILIIAGQVAIFVYLSLLGKPKPADALVLPWPTIEVAVAVGMVAITSGVLGLLVGALVRTVEQTTPVLVVLVMAQLVLSGGLFELSGQKVLEQVSWISPTRWGYAAGASTVDLTRSPLLHDTLWVHSAGAWWRSMLILFGQLVVLVVATRLALRRLEPGRQN
jgi:ABC-type multidrug transport system ATPase subunit